MDAKSIDVAGLRIAYLEYGPADAPPLVLLHATGESAADWESVRGFFDGVRRVLALDLRGHGASGWPGAYSLELMRDDVMGFLDALGLPRVSLIGHSLGGIVAYLIAQSQPERVDRLVLEDVSTPRPRKPNTPDRPPGDLPFDWDMVLAVRADIDSPDPVWLEGLSGITAKTLVIGGGPSSPVPQQGVAELAELIPDSELITIPAGHLVHATQPGRFAEEVNAFLRS